MNTLKDIALSLLISVGFVGGLTYWLVHEDTVMQANLKEQRQSISNAVYIDGVAYDKRGKKQ